MQRQLSDIVPTRKTDDRVHEISTMREFNVARGSHLPVYIKFGASWCASCEELTPLFEAASKKEKNTLFYSVEVDKDENTEDLSRQFGITALPTVVMFLKNERLGTWIGSVAVNKFK